jgi:hypothetical protein
MEFRDIGKHLPRTKWVFSARRDPLSSSAITSGDAN